MSTLEERQRRGEEIVTRARALAAADPDRDILDTPERGAYFHPDEEIPDDWLSRVRPKRAPTWDQDLIPDPGPSPSHHTEPDRRLDEELQKIGIVEAYRRWCGKMEPKVGNRRESIMVSCPVPGHADANPSAWLNSEKNLGNCAQCGGFDIWDIWAMNHDYPFPGYRRAFFPEVREKVAYELGFALVRSGGVETVVGMDEEIERGSDEETPSNVTELFPQGDEYQATFTGESIDWRNLLDPNSSTFLWDWLVANDETDLPIEYYFWVGLIGLGLVVSNHITLADTLPVRANLMVCVLGSSGLGKSRAMSPMKTLLREVSGIQATEVESAQALHKRLLKPILDTEDEKIVIGYEPVSYLAHVDEISSMISRSQRSGSTLKQALMSLFDSSHPWGYDAKGEPLPEAEGHFVSALTSSQPKRLGSLLDRDDIYSGFLNRWIYATGKPKKPVSLGRPNIIDIPTFVAKLRSIRAWAMSHNDMIELDQEAFELWDQFFKENLARFRTGEDEDSDAFVRVELMMKKLMLLFAIDTRQKWISRRNVEQAISLWPYLQAGYAFITTETSASAEVKLSNELEQLILKMAKVRRTKSEIRTFIGPSRLDRLGGSESFIRKFELLVKMGMLEEIKSGRSCKYQASPATEAS